VVNKAFDNDLVSGKTVRVFKKANKLLKRNANARDRILKTEEFSRLFEHSPYHIRAVLVTAFYEGMRRCEILSLTWDKIDVGSRVIKLEAGDTKDREARMVQICRELHDI
jgi:integrase